MIDKATIDAVKELRALGARRVRIGEIEVEWSAPPHAPASAPARLKPEEAQRQQRAAEEEILFAASG